jgi:LPS sulfotransferase NodH
MIFFSKNKSKKKIESTIRNLISQDHFSEERLNELFTDYGSREVTYPNIIGDSSIYKKFIILSKQRSGSTYLASLLQSHPNVVCYNELFHQEKCHFNYPFFPMETNSEMISIRNDFPKYFIEEIVFRKYLHNFKAVGFKLLYNQTFDEKNERAWDLLFKNKNIHIVHLIRKNYLHAFISLKLALSTGVWSMPVSLNKNNSETGLLKSPNPELMQNPISFNLDIEETKKYFLDSEKDIMDFTLAINNHPVLEVFYEDFLNNSQSAINNTLAFLGLGSHDLHSSTIKQNRFKASEIVTNYSELKEFFRNTKWEVFFIE